MIKKVLFIVDDDAHKNMGKSMLLKSLREHSGTFENDVFTSR